MRTVLNRPTTLLATLALAMLPLSAPAQNTEAAPETTTEAPPETDPTDTGDASVQGDPEGIELVIKEAGDDDLDMYHWVARPLVIFADSPNDPRFIQQMEFIEQGWRELAERDVLVITDTDPAAGTPIRDELRPRGFVLVLLGKDGFKYLRKSTPWKVREISRSIDKMPLRQQELRDLRATD